jgi:DNA-binding response OmpR family regulator
MVVDDDPTNTKLLRYLLQDEGYEVTTTRSPQDAIEHLTADHIDLVILDIQLAEMNGLMLCRHIRERININIPIMIVSSLADVKDKVSGLQAGADDYLAKPYDPNELVARTWALLRRSSQLSHSESNLKNADLSLDPGNNQVTLTRTGETLSLTPIETRLLRFLVSHPGRSLTREAMVIKVWGYEYDTKSNQLDVYISRLRNKIEEDPSDPKLIQTIRGIGYRFQPSLAGSIWSTKTRRGQEAKR